ncbi:MAG: NUDIX domain-containing protein [Chlamydiota bacterium]|nr:NUDIX domain-containing protein [Chlamydiota bacterium]
MNKLFHKGIYGIIKQDDTILLIKKTRGLYKNYFDLPGGRQEEGETHEQALVREIEEETGVIPKKWKYTETFHYQCDYLQNGKLYEFHHEGLIYMIEEFDAQNIDFFRSLEDSGGCEWKAIDKDIQFSPFAKMICKQLSTRH